MSWSASATELLAGPRGRRVCFELVSPYRHETSLRACPGWHDLRFGSAEVDVGQLAGELAALVAAADLDAMAGTESETGLLVPAAAAVEAAAYWQPPYDAELALLQPDVAAVLAPVARAVTAAPAAAWWSTPLDFGRQQYVQFLAQEDGQDLDPPAFTGAAARVARWRSSTRQAERAASIEPSEPAASYSGDWWSGPALSGLVTTTRWVRGIGAVGLCLVEDWLGWTEALCWPLRPHADARVYEIYGPADWTNLVARYPLEVSRSRLHDWRNATGRVGTWLIPDFAAVAADYDAVHLSVAGYLTTAGRALRVAGAGTMLAGWDPDQTYWFDDLLDLAGPTLRWENSDGQPVGWVAAPGHRSQQAQ